MSQPFIGEIRMFGGSFAPRSWAFCNGQLLAIAQNDALFSLLGTTYGGDGQNTFALPDLRGRIPVHRGQGSGLSPYDLGQVGGVESVTLLTQQLPAHSHAFVASTAAASPTSEPGGSVTAAASAPLYVEPSGALAGMSSQAITPVGGTQPHGNVAPFQCVSFIICLEGIYPSRN